LGGAAGTGRTLPRATQAGGTDYGSAGTNYLKPDVANLLKGVRPKLLISTVGVQSSIWQTSKPSVLASALMTAGLLFSKRNLEKAEEHGSN
jgi:hypothetical protein